MFFHTCGPSLCGGGPSGQFAALAAVAPNATAALETPAVFRKARRSCSIRLLPKLRVDAPRRLCLSHSDLSRQHRTMLLRNKSFTHIRQRRTLRPARRRRIMLPQPPRSGVMRGRHGGEHHDGNRTDANYRLVLESLGTTRPRPDRHDGDLVPAICVDALHRSAQSKARNDACGIAVDLFAAHHSANLVLAGAGLSG